MTLDPKEITMGMKWRQYNKDGFLKQELTLLFIPFQIL